MAGLAARFDTGSVVHVMLTDIFITLDSIREPQVAQRLHHLGRISPPTACDQGLSCARPLYTFQSPSLNTVNGQVILACKGEDRTILVSDAAPVAGCAPGHYTVR